MSALAGIVLALFAVGGASITTPKLPLPVPVPTVQVPLPLPLPLPVVTTPVPTVPPPVPTVRVPLPTPVPTSSPVPARTPAAPASGPAAEAGPAATTPTAAPQRPHAGTVSAPAPRSARGAPHDPRPERRRPPARRGDAAPSAPTPRPAAAPHGERRAATVAERRPLPSPRPGARTRGPVATVVGDIGDVVAALPAAVLWALLGTASIALWLAGNAYWQSRRRTALEAQRAELLQDVGLLSSALLPAVPALDGLTVSAAYRPADGPAAGGDFYDVFELDDGRICVLLGDVSGHGRDSVTHAALARYTLRTLLVAGHGPERALALADRMLVRDLAPRFVTVIAAVFDRRTAVLTYAKAGHQPPIVLGAPHDPDAEEPACPIGIGLGDRWPEYTLELGEATSVCLYTDGLEDARLAEARLGREEVLRLLAAQEAPDAARLIHDISRLADRLSDDLTAVVLRRASAPAPAAVEGPAADPGHSLDDPQVVLGERA